MGVHGTQVIHGVNGLVAVEGDIARRVMIITSGRLWVGCGGGGGKPTTEGSHTLHNVGSDGRVGVSGDTVCEEVDGDLPDSTSRRQCDQMEHGLSGDEDCVGSHRRKATWMNLACTNLSRLESVSKRTSVLVVYQVGQMMWGVGRGGRVDGGDCVKSLYLTAQTGTMERGVDESRESLDRDDITDS
ncbi:hypothetical protein Tco_0401894 [Tanacetum coccineum]